MRFSHRLALALGRTVGELNLTLSPDEWVRWMAYYQLEPFGSPADDDRFRVLVQHVAAPYLKAGIDLPMFFDRDPQPEPEQDEDEDEAFEAFFAPFLGK